MRWIVVCVLALAALVSSNASANGRFPASNLVVFDPNDADHLIVRTTFGHLESRNGGQSFDFVCESALRLGVEEDPMLAFTSSGSLVIATFGGLLTSNDGCSFDDVRGHEGEVIPDLAACAAAPDTLVAFRLLGLGGGLYQGSILRSDDGARSFQRLLELPSELLPLTVDLAARDPARVYLTARRGNANEFDSALLVSRDGGSTFETRPVPGSAGQRLAYIAGVDPGDADRLYVRIDDPAGTVLLATGDAGASFERLFTGTGSLPGFAVSTDGSIALGGPDDGVWAGDSHALTRRSDVRPTCLAYDARGLLYACTDSRNAGFSLARSADQGASFEPLLDFIAVCGESSCGASSDVGALCASGWADVAAALDASCDLASGSPIAHGGCSLSSPSSNHPRAPLAPSSRCVLLALAAVALTRRRTKSRPFVRP